MSIAVEATVLPKNPKSITKLASEPPEAPGSSMKVLKRLTAAASEMNFGRSAMVTGAPSDIAAKKGSV